MRWGKQMVVGRRVGVGWGGGAVQSVYRLTSFGGYCSVSQLGKCAEVFWMVIMTRGEEQVT